MNKLNNQEAKTEEEYQSFVAEARRCFEREDRENACHWYTRAGLHHRPDAEFRDLGDFLVVAIEFRPDLAGDVARLILKKREPIPLVYIQDIFCCALQLQDSELEKMVTQRVFRQGKPSPNTCARIADMYADYGTTRRDQAKAVIWMLRAAEAQAEGFNDWAVKANAFYVTVEDEERARLAALGCAQKAIEEASTVRDLDLDALDDLIEALGFAGYEGRLLEKALYERLLANDHLPLPEKHRVWQDLKALQETLKDS